MRWNPVVLVIAVALVASACSSGGGDGVVVEDPWGRTSPQVATNAAFYMVVKGGEDADRLVAVAAEICGSAELHRTTVTDDVAKMQQVEGGIEIPAGGEVALEPGGYHVMCIDKAEELKVGDTVTLTLTFENAASQTVDAEIREE